MRNWQHNCYTNKSSEVLSRSFCLALIEQTKANVWWSDLHSTSPILASNARGEGGKIKKLLAIDGKTQRGNGNKNQKANHIVSAVDENGFCLGERLVSEKSNEITAIPELLNDLNIKGHILLIAFDQLHPSSA